MERLDRHLFRNRHIVKLAARFDSERFIDIKQ